MIYIEITPQVSTMRAYDQPKGYEKRLPYQAILTVSHLSDTTVYLHGAVGKVDRETWDAAFKMLRERGVTLVQIERHGKMKFIDLTK